MMSEDQSGHDGGGDPSAEVVGHDAPAAAQALQPADGARLDDIKKTEEGEREADGDPAAGKERQSDELAADFVDDDAARVGAAQLGRVKSGGLDADDDQDDEDEDIERPRQAMECKLVGDRRDERWPPCPERGG